MAARAEADPKTLAYHRARAEISTLVGAYLAVVLIYLYSFGRSAWSPNDPEHIMAYAWRLVQGEVPYRDFIYHKPPGTLWLHRIWLSFPDGWAIVASRLAFYLQIAASGLLPILSARRLGMVFSWRLPLLGVVALIFALHNFPAMPWQTSDGVFFSTLGLAALMESWRSSHCKRALIARALASASFTYAFLCKQSFFLPAVLIGVIAVGEGLRWVFFERHRQPNARPALELLAASTLPAMIMVGSFLLYLRVNGAMEQFILQMRSQSSVSALLEYGLLNKDSQFRWVIGVAALLPALQRIGARSDASLWFTRLSVAVSVLLLGRIARAWAGEPFGNPLGAVLFFLLLGSFLGRLLLAIADRIRPGQRSDLLTNSRLLWMHCFLIAIAWSAQLSLGWPTPLLGLAGLGVVLHEVLPLERNVAWNLMPVSLTAAIVFVTFWKLNREHPYCELSREKLTWDLAPISPKLSGIRTNEELFRRYAELKELAESYALTNARPFVVLAEFPGVYWLWGARNPLRIDWLYPPDIAGFENDLLQELNSSGAVAFLPKDATACEKITTADYNALAKAVVEGWRLIGSRQSFCVYSR